MEEINRVYCEHKDAKCSVSLFTNLNDHQIICEDCYLKCRDEWQLNKVLNDDYSSNDPCALCGGNLPTRFDKEYECNMCQNCIREHQQAFNIIMIGKSSHLPEFDLPSEIIEGSVYLGSHRSSVSSEYFDCAKIQLVVVCCSHLRIYHPSHPNLQYHRVPLTDLASELLTPQTLLYVCDLIDKTVAKGAAVLIHCHQGISRSASICIAWLMRKNKWSYVEAHEFVKARRDFIYPNFGFVEQLTIWEKSLLNDSSSTVVDIK